MHAITCMQHLGLRLVATACSASCCLALNRKRRHQLKSMIMMTCGSSQEHDVLDTKHGAHKKGSHQSADRP
jgi:hypothetical protein